MGSPAAARRLSLRELAVCRNGPVRQRILVRPKRLFGCVGFITRPDHQDHFTRKMRAAADRQKIAPSNVAPVARAWRQPRLDTSLAQNE